MPIVTLTWEGVNRELEGVPGSWKLFSVIA